MCRAYLQHNSAATELIVDLAINHPHADDINMYHVSYFGTCTLAASLRLVLPADLSPVGSGESRGLIPLPSCSEPHRGAWDGLDVETCRHIEPGAGIRLSRFYYPARGAEFIF